VLPKREAVRSRLDRRRLPRLQALRQRLALPRAILRLLRLFQARFPEAYAAVVPDDLSWQALPQVVDAFLGTVREQAFPVWTLSDTCWDCEPADDLWDLLDQLWQYAGSPPVVLYGFPHEQVDEPVYGLVLALIGEGEDLLDMALPDWDAVQGRLQTLPDNHPLRALLDLAAMAFQATGNLFLDHDPDYDGCYHNELDWEADFDWLVTDWAAAEPVLDRIWQLTGWLDRDPSDRMEQVVGFMAGKDPAPDIRAS